MFDRFATLTTPHLADACLRAGIPVRCAPTGVRALAPGMRIAGRVLPAVHSGSVDVFLEAVSAAQPGDVLVADNGGRLDEACIGDLAVLDAAAGGVSGIVIWGLHRDSADIAQLGMPLFSLGTLPTGPQRLDPRVPDALTTARVGEWAVTRADAVFGDDDGVLFVPLERVEELLEVAAGIAATEGRQADLIRAGTSLRDQVRFGDYLAARAIRPDLTFRDHLRGVGGEIEV
ncbi:RraA family protein [Pseudolysinimonas yzui]|uniref:Putative 4-hydroxy-4-methyl-2-oxoglutarate aldolase n=1 Tax=Pseudolysinimonas yzui TaxID=2708254 RepID=A0A8J3GQE8_9MICO|nr:RraA family protein [Pseudolysinimonas yzui]GHF15058.1 demethylmenaquinone methyltransferase [Pseudolysinimonas yzui]